MTGNSIELGRRYFCREETSGQSHNGTFHIEGDEIAVTLCSFDKPLPKNFDDLMVLRLENNQIVSLHHNVPISGTTYHAGPSKPGPYVRSIASNIAVIGPDIWTMADPIRRVQFSIEHADELLHHSDKFDAVADATFGTMPDTTLFELHAAGVKVHVWYAPSGSMMFRRATTIGVRYSIEFEEPANLDSYLSVVQCVVRFISAAMAHRFAPSEINISRLSQADFLKSVEDKTSVSDHGVRYIWRVTAPTRDQWVGHSFAHVVDDKELEAFTACLKTWIERDAEWRDATNLMMTSLSLAGVISGERLLTACKWLEEIPGAASAMAVSDEDIAAIATAAAAEAERLKHSDYKDRIAGVIRGQLKTETNSDRFKRLRLAVCARFGGTALDADVVTHLLRAMQFRGRVAHGHFSPADEAEHRAFVKAIYAMEAVCYLLTLKDLPMIEQGAKRAIGQEIASNYRRCAY